MLRWDVLKCDVDIVDRLACCVCHLHWIMGNVVYTRIHDRHDVLLNHSLQHVYCHDQRTLAVCVHIIIIQSTIMKRKIISLAFSVIVFHLQHISFTWSIFTFSHFNSSQFFIVLWLVCFIFRFFSFSFTQAATRGLFMPAGAGTNSI